MGFTIAFCLLPFCSSLLTVHFVTQIPSEQQPEVLQDCTQDLDFDVLTALTITDMITFWIAGAFDMFSSTVPFCLS